MSYPQFNLTTLQLPAPASNMTKTEYKAAYGIDLDEINIKAFKLVLLGNEKYPIDQIKEVEDGYEIYFNGRILSITDIVQTSDEVYDVANSKPIYLHPIFVSYQRSDSQRATFTCLIFNNSPTAMTKETFLSYAVGLFDEYEDASIMASGFVGLQPASRLKKHPELRPSAIALETVKANGAENEFFTIEEATLANADFHDGVNKIN